MNTLFIDTHGEKILLAIYQEEKLCFKKEGSESQNHSTICMPLLTDLLAEANLLIQDIDDIIVVNGPGSFTGVRIGITIGKTLAFTLKIPIRTMTSLELYIDDAKENEYLVLKEKNGVYVGQKTQNQIVDYQYIKTSDLEDWVINKNICYCEKINEENLCIFAHQKSPTNPHIVNPLYVKKIEVENDKKS